MAKKIYFKSINEETVNTINTILDVIFVNAYERKALSNEAKKIEKELEEFKANEENKDASTLEFSKKLQIVKNKRDALRTWTDTTLRTHKNPNDEWEDGLFATLGVNKALCETYLECRDNNTWGKWNATIKNMLVETYGMSLDDKLVGKFASYLEHQVGSSCAGINQILKGQLLKPQTVRNFSEIMVRAIATYISQTNDNVTIPTVEFYVATVTYDEHINNVESYEVSEKVEETPVKEA